MTIRLNARPTSRAYLGQTHDPVRKTFERTFFEEELGRLLDAAPGRRVLDLGCGDGLLGDLAAGRVDDYVGVDLHPPDDRPGRRYVAHDLAEGLGPVGREPFDLYVASFGVVSHLQPTDFERLCREIALRPRPGAIVALEALGLYSLEWPGLWETRPGPRRALPYRLAEEIEVHPWAPGELASAFERAGIEPLRMVDRSVQAGPKLGDQRYWPGVPPLRAALNALLQGQAAETEALAAPLPALPAHPAASVHLALTERRQRLLSGLETCLPQAVAREVWALEPGTGGGFGHGLLAVGRVS